MWKPEAVTYKKDTLQLRWSLFGPTRVQMSLQPTGSTTMRVTQVKFRLFRPHMLLGNPKKLRLEGR